MLLIVIISLVWPFLSHLNPQKALSLENNVGLTSNKCVNLSFSVVKRSFLKNKSIRTLKEPWRAFYLQGSPKVILEKARGVPRFILLYQDIQNITNIMQLKYKHVISWLFWIFEHFKDARKQLFVSFTTSWKQSWKFPLLIPLFPSKCEHTCRNW